jgi:hypothetical protein
MYFMLWRVKAIYYSCLKKRIYEVIMTEIEKETGMTDAECEYWDEYITKNPVHLGPDLVKMGVKPGFARDYLPLNELDELDHDVMEYLLKQAAAFHKSQIQIINDLVREKLAVGA